jgi:hypothetical protein
MGLDARDRVKPAIEARHLSRGAMATRNLTAMRLRLSMSLSAEVLATRDEEKTVAVKSGAKPDLGLSITSIIFLVNPRYQLHKLSSLIVHR